MDRLNHVNIKQEGDEDQKEVSWNNEEKQQDNEGSSSQHDNLSPSNINIKQEFDEDAPQKVSINNAQQQQNSLGLCAKVKKEDESVECKVELNVDDCDCLECRSFTGERPYQCPWNGCDKTFDQKCHTLAHLKLHTPKRAYVCICEYCGKGFRIRVNLFKHIRCHTGEKLYKCTWNGCKKAFSRRKYLVQHRKFHARMDKLLKCPGPAATSHLVMSRT